MASLSGDKAVIPSGKMMKLANGTGVAEDQAAALNDSAHQALLDQVVSLNPGLVCLEVFTLVGSETSVSVSKKIKTLYGVVGFASGILSYADSATLSTLGITATAVDGTDKKKINITGTAAAGKLLVLYLSN